LSAKQQAEGVRMGIDIAKSRQAQQKSEKPTKE
jgi:hypothetical protein